MVIDYAIRNLEIRERIKSLKIGDKVDSDYHPVEVWVEDRGDRKKKGKKEWRGIWDEEGRKEFKQSLGKIEIGTCSLEEQWREMEKRIKEALEEVESKREEGNRRKVGWWDEECKEAKRKARRKLREWRKKREGEEEYKGRKKEYRGDMREKKERVERGMGKENKRCKKGARSMGNSEQGKERKEKGE